jgi:hypothetical protein
MRGRERAISQNENRTKFGRGGQIITISWMSHLIIFNIF